MVFLVDIIYCIEDLKICNIIYEKGKSCEIITVKMKAVYEIFIRWLDVQSQKTTLAMWRIITYLFLKYIYYVQVVGIIVAFSLVHTTSCNTNGTKRSCIIRY